jgi:hypothetical protein
MNWLGKEKYMSDWVDCIVSYIDLIGISKELDDNTADAIRKMREMHKIAYDAANNSMAKHKNVYYWNDSVLMLALPNSTHDYEPIMHEVNRLKRAIDRICQTYAISMKGQTIPEILPCTRDHFTGGQIDQPRAVYIRASSLAFSNCFEVERKLGKTKKPWYVDERIVKHISTSQSRTCQTIKLHPRRTPRKMFLYDGDLWNEDLQSQP